MRRVPLSWRWLLVVCLAAALPACARSSGAGSSGSVRVVAAENVYGDIAGSVGGDVVEVTSILSNPDADPHLFEPGTANAAAVAGADVVIVNGLDYDAFMQKLLEAAPSSGRIVVTVSKALGIAGRDANPHFWYDVPKLPSIVAAIAGALERAAPASAAAIRSRAASFDRSLEPLEQATEAIRRSHAGEPVAYTEPVPGYLVQAAGLTVRTPEDFARAIEEGSEPSPQAVAQMEALITGRQVRVLLYNSQATSPITDHIRSLAGATGIPVVAVTETLPPGRSFVAWQLGQVQALAAALGTPTP